MPYKSEEVFDLSSRLPLSRKPSDCNHPGHEDGQTLKAVDTLLDPLVVIV